MNPKTFLKVLKYLALAEQVIAAVEGAKAGKIDQDLKGIKWQKETWDLHLTGQRRP